jgi:Beta-lactamase
MPCRLKGRVPQGPTSVRWGESDTGDHRRFPARPVRAGPDRSPLRRPADGGRVPPPQVRRVEVREGERRVERDLAQFLAASDTTGQGRIGSVNDPITRYGPELAERDRRFAKITLRQLLTMTSRLRYQQDGGPFGDDTATYDAPDLRALAVGKTEVMEAPGRRFHDNNVNPLLVGLALERAVGMPVASYLEAKLWQPAGMEAAGSWSLDRHTSSFEKMESGLNARAADFARFGLLDAHDGTVKGRQLLPRAWVQDPTLVPTRGRAPAGAYQSFWWSTTSADPPPASPWASTASTSMSSRTPTWSWSASATTPATGTGPNSSTT